jgi:hypothetical protein
MNESENIKYQNLQDIMKAMIRGEFIALNTTIFLKRRNISNNQCTFPPQKQK